MHSCVGISIETVLQVVKFYIVVNLVLNGIHSDEGLQSERFFKNSLSIHYGVKFNYL